MKNSETNNIQSHSRNTMLCDGLLIPMTDFVIKQNYITTLDISQIDFYDKELKTLSNIRNYAKFLKQPLKLEMFVPCDDNGNILGEPKKTNYQVDVNTKCSGWKYLYDSNDKLIGYYDDRKWKEDFVKYKQSKEKVLFVFKPHFDISVMKHHISQGRNIEYLANFGSMQLTKNALNAIFG